MALRFKTGSTESIIFELTVFFPLLVETNVAREQGIAWQEPEVRGLLILYFRCRRIPIELWQMIGTYLVNLTEKDIKEMAEKMQLQIRQADVVSKIFDITGYYDHISYIERIKNIEALYLMSDVIISAIFKKCEFYPYRKILSLEWLNFLKKPYNTPNKQKRPLIFLQLEDELVSLKREASKSFQGIIVYGWSTGEKSHFWFDFQSCDYEIKLVAAITFIQKRFLKITIIHRRSLKN